MFIILDGQVFISLGHQVNLQFYNIGFSLLDFSICGHDSSITFSQSWVSWSLCIMTFAMPWASSHLALKEISIMKLSHHPHADHIALTIVQHKHTNGSHHIVLSKGFASMLKNLSFPTYSVLVALCTSLFLCTSSYFSPDGKLISWTFGSVVHTDIILTLVEI